MERFLISILLVSLWGGAGVLAVMLLSRIRALALPAKWLRMAYIVLLVGLLMPVRPAFWQISPEEAVQSAPARETVQAAPMPSPGQVTFDFTNIPQGGMSLPEPVQQQPRREIDWVLLGFGVWAAGAAWMIALPVRKHMRFLRMVRRWGERDLSTERRTGVRAYRCAFVHSAFCAGVFRPMLLLPEEEETDENILRHEMAHLRQKDLWLRAVCILAKAVHWFNPALRLLDAELTAACEMCADEICMRGADPDGRRRYAETVLRSTFAPAARAPLTMQFTGGKKMMKRRIYGILVGNMGRFGALAIVLALVCTLMAPAVMAYSAAQAQFAPSVPPLGLARGATTGQIVSALTAEGAQVEYGRRGDGTIELIRSGSAVDAWPGSGLEYHLEFMVYPQEQTLCSYRFAGEYGPLGAMTDGDRQEIGGLIDRLDGILTGLGTRHVLTGPEEAGDPQGADWLEENGEIRIWYIAEAFDAQLLCTLSDAGDVVLALDVGDLSGVALSEQERGEIDSIKYTTFAAAYSEEGSAAAEQILQILDGHGALTGLSGAEYWRAAQEILLQQAGGETFVLRMASMEIVPELINRLALALATGDCSGEGLETAAKLLEAYLGADEAGTIALDAAEQTEIRSWVDEWSAATAGAVPQNIGLAPLRGVNWGSGMADLIPKIANELNETGEIIPDLVPTGATALQTHAFEAYPGFHYSFEPCWLYTAEDELYEMWLLGKRVNTDSMTEPVRGDIDSLLRQMSGHFAGYEILVYGPEGKPAPEAIRRGFGLDLAMKHGGFSVFYVAPDGSWAQIDINMSGRELAVDLMYSAVAGAYDGLFAEIRAEYAQSGV